MHRGRQRLNARILRERDEPQRGARLNYYYQQALIWHRKAAEQGYAESQYNLGVMYANVQGVPQDDKQALSWFRKAADQGYADSQYNLGVMYANGQGAPQNLIEAVFWFRKAAEQGVTRAHFNLGIMYDEGLGVPKDDQQAYFWFLLASVNGDEISVKNRDLVENRLTPQQRSAAQTDARNWQPTKQ